MTTEELVKVQQASDAGRRVAAFLEDEAIKGALIALEKKYIGEFKESKTPAEREAVHAKFIALQDITTSALGIMDNGKVANIHLAQHQRTQEARQSRNLRAR